MKKTARMHPGGLALSCGLSARLRSRYPDHLFIGDRILMQQVRRDVLKHSLLSLQR
ncbi:MAG: hypothetical protein RLZZ324_779, partial [Candidatus Parcubacteria bacterium]